MLIDSKQALPRTGQIVNIVRSDGIGQSLRSSTFRLGIYNLLQHLRRDASTLLLCGSGKGKSHGYYQVKCFLHG